MSYGLSENQLSQTVAFLAKFSAVEKADFLLAAHIKNELEEETSLPFFFDIIAYDSIDNDPLKEHIRTYGKVLYTKN